jgi:hypothetical protein
MAMYRMRAKELQPTLYMTLGGVVQSFALAMLFTTVKEPVNTDVFTFHSTENWIFWVKFTIAFEIIVLVWHEYASGLIYFWWEWTMIDSFIPFAMGAAEFYLIAHMSSSPLSSWLRALGWVSLVGGASYLNQLLRASRYDENKDALNIIRTIRILGIVSLAVLTAVFWCMASARQGKGYTAQEHLRWQVRLLVVPTFMLVSSWWTYSRIQRKLG